MSECWEWDAARRPSFQEIHLEMENLFKIFQVQKIFKKFEFRKKRTPPSVDHEFNWWKVYKNIIGAPKMLNKFWCNIFSFFPPFSYVYCYYIYIAGPKLFFFIAGPQLSYLYCRTQIIIVILQDPNYYINIAGPKLLY